MSKWVEVRDEKGVYWKKKHTDVKNYVIVVLACFCIVCVAMYMRAEQENYYLNQEIEYYQAQPDYFQPQD